VVAIFSISGIGYPVFTSPHVFHSALRVSSPCVPAFTQWVEVLLRAVFSPIELKCPLGRFVSLRLLRYKASLIFLVDVED